MGPPDPVLRGVILNYSFAVPRALLHASAEGTAAEGATWGEARRWPFRLCLSRAAAVEIPLFLLLFRQVAVCRHFLSGAGLGRAWQGYGGALAVCVQTVPCGRTGLSLEGKHFEKETKGPCRAAARQRRRNPPDGRGRGASADDATGHAGL